MKPGADLGELILSVTQGLDSTGTGDFDAG
jgi:hypothetical protein